MAFLESDDGRFSWSRTPVYKFVKGQTNDSIEDPTYLGFVLLFHFDNPIGIGDGAGTSPLLGAIEQEGSALNYLQRNKEFVRVEYLKQFIKLLQKINYELPWYWQSFEGGERFVKYNNFDDPYLGGEESKVTIECLEAMDLKMTALMDLYRNAVYDLEYRRVIIPSNLRKFAIDIHVQEVRKFHISKLEELKSATNKINTAIKGPGSNTANTDEAKNDNTPKLVFKLRYCEFLPDESNIPFASISAAHGDGNAFAKQKVVFSFENIAISNSYPNIGEGLFIDSDKVNLASNNIPTGKFDNSAKKFSKNPFLDKVINSTVEGSLAIAENAVTGQLSKLILGNVYGLNTGVATGTVQNALDTGSVFSLGPQILNQGDATKPSAPKNLGNIFGRA